MPFGNRTGPAGMVPITERAAGFCAGYPVTGYMNSAMGGAGFYDAGAPAVGPYGAGYGMLYGGRINPWLRRGFVFGRGFGRGWSVCRGRGRRVW